MDYVDQKNFTEVTSLLCFVFAPVHRVLSCSCSQAVAEVFQTDLLCVMSRVRSGHWQPWYFGRRKQERKDELLWSVDDIRPRFFLLCFIAASLCFLVSTWSHTHSHNRMKALAIHDLWTDEEKEGDCLDIRNVGWVEHHINYCYLVIW